MPTATEVLQSALAAKQQALAAASKSVNDQIRNTLIGAVICLFFPLLYLIYIPLVGLHWFSLLRQKSGAEKAVREIEQQLTEITQ